MELTTEERKLQLLRQIEFDLEDIRNMRNELFKLMGFEEGDLEIETKINPTKQLLLKNNCRIRHEDYGIYRLYRDHKLEYEGTEYACYEHFMKNLELWQ